MALRPRLTTGVLLTAESEGDDSGKVLRATRLCNLVCSSSPSYPTPADCLLSGMATPTLSRPADDEFAPFYGTYVSKVPEGDVARFLFLISTINGRAESFMIIRRGERWTSPANSGAGSMYDHGRAMSTVRTPVGRLFAQSGGLATLERSPLT